MQMRTAADYPQRMGKVTGFGVAPTEYLELIRSDLGLTMPLQSLSYIQNHYRMAERREPDVGELIMLDILMWNARQRGLRTRRLDLMELSTDSEDIRDTFEDMMRKLSALEPKRSGPVSFDKMLGVSGAYIGSIMPERYFEGLSVSFCGEKNAALMAKAAGSEEVKDYFAGSLDFALASAPRKISIKEGIYIQIEKHEELSEFLDALRKEKIKFSARIVRNNIIEEIAADTNHAEIAVPFSIPELAAFGEGDLLLLCPDSFEKDIVYMGNLLSLRMRRAGRKLKKGDLIFKNPVFESVIHASFIRGITDIKPVEAVNVSIGKELIDGKADCRFEMISMKPRNDDFEAAVSHDGGRDDISLICAASDMSSPYENGIAQVVCSAAGAIAAGASIEDIKLKNVIRYPLNSDPSLLTAHILGIYRAETELCLSARESELAILADIAKPESRSLSLAQKKATGGFGEGALWLVSPETKNDKLCFENIRRTFSYMTELISGGHAIRACALDTEGFSGEESLAGAEQSKRGKTAVGSFLVLTRAELIPSEGVLTERIGAIGISDDGEELPGI
ncbi:MAG: hypothetical protein IJZ89_07260 [Clostridia bacterium]|nr:hypothetical protein [Clostridia bacterium]